MDEQEELEEGIRSAIEEVRDSKAFDKMNSLSRINPRKVGKILFLISTGVSQTQMVRKHKITRSTLVSVLTDYSDYLGKFRELGGKLSARSYINLESLEEDVVDALRRKIEAGYIPEFKDLKEVSIAKSNSQRQAMTARGEASNITEERKVYTQEDYEDTLKAVRDRMRKEKQADIINIDE